MLYDSMDIYSQIQSRRNSGMSSSRATQGRPSFSSQSVLAAVQRFVSSVNAMNETIMIPCRLLDMDVSNHKHGPVPELLRGDKDPYAAYGVLNATKNDLMYGLPMDDDDDTPQINIEYSDRWSSPSPTNLTTDRVSTLHTHSHTTSIPTHTTNSNSSSSTNISVHSSSSSTTKQHVRRISALSMISVASSSDGTSETNDNITEEVTEGGSDAGDSGVGTEETISVAQANTDLRIHLTGLYSCLSQLSDAANYISDRYQDELID